MLNDLIERKDGDEDAIFNILSKKGVFPYEFMDSIDKLNYDRK